MKLLGIDLGSSSIKASLLDVETGRFVGSATSPETEMVIASPEPGFAEQNPAMWYRHAVKAVQGVMGESGVVADEVKAIGIAYQMHGLVCVDVQGNVLRPSIIWCDSRAVSTGDRDDGGDWPEPLSRAPAQLSRQLHSRKARVGEGERARGLPQDSQDHAAGRLAGFRV